MKTMLSGIKPSGKVTLGNYIGALKNFISYQDEYEMYIFVANLHAITVPQEKLELRKSIKNLIAIYLASGLDPKKVTLFMQSDVLEHANLGFILNCNCSMGELSRMTQYKDKTQKVEEGSISVGLFTYPALMAADILLYDADYVPVGEDQKQHVELTRDIAERFNKRYGPTFKMPEPIIPKVGARIMSLSNPLKKMSKSDEAGDKGCIYLLDDVAIARKKIMSAVTDNLGIVQFDPINQPGISNLLAIASALSGQTMESFVQLYQGSNYGTFKSAVAEIVGDFLTNFQKKYHEIIASNVSEQVLKEGAEKARLLARKKLSKVLDRLGLSYQ